MWMRRSAAVAFMARSLEERLWNVMLTRLLSSNSIVDPNNPYCNCYKSQKPFYQRAEYVDSRQRITGVDGAQAMNQQADENSSSTMATTNKLKSLSVGLIGVPNVGKSSLINALVGATVCPYSQRTHTTRERNSVILTFGDVQITLVDTPGIVSLKDARHFNLSTRAEFDAARVATSVDLIAVVQDVSNRYTREAINKDVLKVLMTNLKTPSILVLNKIDTMVKKDRRFHLTKKLTCNHLGQVQAHVQPIQPVYSRGQRTTDMYFAIRRRQEKDKREYEQALLTSGGDAEDMQLASSELAGQLSITPGNRPDRGGKKVVTVADWMRQVTAVVSAASSANAAADVAQMSFANSGCLDLRRFPSVDDMLHGVVGWPAFSDVLPVSAATGKGVDALRNYLIIAAAERGAWVTARQNQRNIKLVGVPREVLAKRILWSKLLDVLATEIPYGLEPEVEYIRDERTHDGSSSNNKDIEILFSIVVRRNRIMSALTMSGGENVAAVARLAESDLASYFGRPVRVLISLLPRFPSRRGEMQSTMSCTGF